MKVLNVNFGEFIDDRTGEVTHYGSVHCISHFEGQNGIVGLKSVKLSIQSLNPLVKVSDIGSSIYDAFLKSYDGSPVELDLELSTVVKSVGNGLSKQDTLVTVVTGLVSVKDSVKK